MKFKTKILSVDFLKIYYTRDGMGQFRIVPVGYGAMVFDYKMKQNVDYKVLSANLLQSFTIDISDYSRVKKR